MLALIGLSGCSGAADAAPTVGPTAGADESVEPADYEPTLPPYTSDVDLSAEDEAEVEELLLLIDEFVSYSSGIDDFNSQGIAKISPHLSEGLEEAYRNTVSDANEKGLQATGSLEIQGSAVWAFARDDYAHFGLCIEFDSWGLIDPDTGLTADGESLDGIRYQVAEIEAVSKETTWTLQNLRFDDESNECASIS
ncbi:hypothetical protein [Brevibacterium jeotgali]|nr:hypothetical protein [Brevibacterium jeotgali]